MAAARYLSASQPSVGILPPALPLLPSISLSLLEPRPQPLGVAAVERVLDVRGGGRSTGKFCPVDSVGSIGKSVPNLSISSKVNLGSVVPGGHVGLERRQYMVVHVDAPVAALRRLRQEFAERRHHCRATCRGNRPQQIPSRNALNWCAFINLLPQRILPQDSPEFPFWLSGRDRLDISLAPLEASHPAGDAEDDILLPIRTVGPFWWPSPRSENRQAASTPQFRQRISARRGQGRCFSPPHRPWRVYEYN